MKQKVEIVNYAGVYKFKLNGVENIGEILVTNIMGEFPSRPMIHLHGKGNVYFCSKRLNNISWRLT